MNPAERIIECFGGISALARALGHRHPTTVQGWRQRGVIPARRQADVLAAARAQNLALSAEDFFGHQAAPSDADPSATGALPEGATPGGASALWGGRFDAGPAAIMREINASISFDKRLYSHDLRGSRAHCRMLVAQGIIAAQDGAAILGGLYVIEKEIAAGEFTFDEALEDIHMHIESRLAEIIGEPAGRLHTARSRNDQVATDLRLWLRDAIAGLDRGLVALQRTLVDKADIHADTIMPGFTHLQGAQPVTFGHHLLAYAEMFDRDRGRFADCTRRLNESPLGAAALAGTAYPIDREATARDLGFDRPMANSLDAVSARDFAIEFLGSAAIAAVHASRLAEEIVLWSSDAFGFITLSDSFSTGSSIMPQKRNPDAAELVRAKSGRVIGSLNTLLIVLKGLPLAYAKDMQEDKEPVFDAVDSLHLAFSALAGMIGDATVNTGAMRRAAGHGFPTATDLADWLVREAGVPFRLAHGITGRIVRLAEVGGCDLADVPLKDMQAVEPAITQAVYDAIGLDQSVASRRSFGGTAPVRVRAAVAAFRERLK